MPRLSSTVKPVAHISDTLVFVDGVLLTEAVAAEISPTHFTVSVPLRVGCEDALRAATEVRITVSVRNDPQSPERTVLLDHVARSYKLDRVSYRCGIGADRQFWIADVRFVKPLTSIKSSDDAAPAA